MPGQPKILALQQKSHADWAYDATKYHSYIILLLWNIFLTTFRYKEGDSLAVYDGSSIAAPMVGEYWGSSIPPSHISSSNKMLLVFKTDEIDTDLGFKLEYHAYGKVSE